MSYFTDFLDEELRLIISIPVRAAFWISHIDDVSGTTHDDEKERAALEKVLRKIYSNTEDSAFTNDVIEEAIKKKYHWPEWEKNAASVVDDVPKAMKLVRDRLPADAVTGYQKAVYYIARVVAQAAQEYKGPEGAKLTPGFFGRVLDRLSVKTDLSAQENVSESEKAGLQKLLAALKG